MKIRRMLGRPKGGVSKVWGLGHLLCPWCCGRNVCVAGAQPYLGPRTRSGDMMMDGVPDVRAYKWVRPLNLSRRSTRVRGGHRRVQGADRRHQLVNGHGQHTQRMSGGAVRDFGGRHRQGGVAEFTQGVIAAAQNFAFDGQGGAFAVAARGHLVVVGVVR